MYFLNIFKPKGITSFDVVKNLRKILNTKEIGHAGTLDPLASGVMQIGVGSATKLLDYLESDKIYMADIEFGYVSDTFDDEGEKTFVKEPDFTQKQLEAALNSFVGKSMQTPPIYSAVKVNGKKLCDLARKGECDVDIKPREIEVYSVEILDFSRKKHRASIKVHAAKGTYIRSLVNDLGKKLGCGAYVLDLIRIKAGCFGIQNAQRLDDELIKINPLSVLNYDKYELSPDELARIADGNFINTDKDFKTKIILLTKDNKLVSVANLSDNREDGKYIIKPKKFFKSEV